MHDLVRRLVRRLDLLFSPGTGSHRAGVHRHRRIPPTTAPAPARLALPRSPYCGHLPLDGAETRLVRPYVTVGERMAAA
ncbi:hypothetical protein NGM37_58245 [Streptomyces sp. TRM76130]|nr:hypothetical protein [Streptomyces sp. TRM76130]